MDSVPMTLQEFQEQATRLHRRYPHAYPYRKQVELAWHVYGLPLDWFKTRVDYVIKSGSGYYDWAGAAKSLKEPVNIRGVPWFAAAIDHLERMDRSSGEAVDVVAKESLAEVLKREGVTSVELVEKKRSQGGESAR